MLRLAAGAALAADAVAVFRLGAPTLLTALGVVALATGVLLIVGLWTPVAGVLAAAVALWHALSGLSAPSLDALSGLLGIALALLGPGGWSVDARLFGWKRLEIRNGDSNGHAARDHGDDSPPI